MGVMSDGKWWLKLLLKVLDLYIFVIFRTFSHKAISPSSPTKAKTLDALTVVFWFYTNSEKSILFIILKLPGLSMYN